MKRTRIIALTLVLISVLLLFCSCIQFHFITDPYKLDWHINHYYVPSGEVDENGVEKHILYSSEVTLCNPFYTANATDTTLSFGENGAVAFVDLNGTVHKGVYEVDKYSELYFDELVMNFDDGLSIKADYFKLRRLDVISSYIVFEHDSVEYIFSTIPALTEAEVAQKEIEMAEWARKLMGGYKLTDEEEDLEFFEIRTVSLGGFPFEYRNHTSSAGLYPSTIEQLRIENGKIEFYCKRKEMNDGWKAEGVRINENDVCTYILIDKDNHIREIEEPLPGDCLFVRNWYNYYFYFFE